jgi:hypothetical protein
MVVVYREPLEMKIRLIGRTRFELTTSSSPTAPAHQASAPATLETWLAFRASPATVRTGLRQELLLLPLLSLLVPVL